MMTGDENHGPDDQVIKTRFTDWALMLVFCVITMGSAADVSGDSISARSPPERHTVAMSTLCFLITFLSVSLHLSTRFSQIFVSSVWEGFCAFLLVLFSCLNVMVVSDSGSELAVDENGRVRVGNLYYFAWASLFWSTGILTNYSQSVVGIDVVTELRNAGKRMTIWSVLFALSVVIFANSAHILRTSCTGDDPDEEGFFCSSAGYGVGSGVLCTVLSGQVIFAKIKKLSLPFQNEVMIAGIVFLFYTFGVAILTSNGGAGAPLGNLYYGSWASFLLSSMNLKSCYENFQDGDIPVSSENNALSTEQASIPPEMSNDQTFVVPKEKVNDQYDGGLI